MDRDPVRRWWPSLVVVGLLAVAAVAAGHSSIGMRRIPPASEDVPFAPEYPTDLPTPSPVAPLPSGVAQDQPAQLPGWLGPALLGLVVLVVLVLLGVILWAMLGRGRRRAGRLAPATPLTRSTEQTTEDVVAAVDAGLGQLDDAATDPRTAVIACWVRLEEAAAAAGVPRRVGDTPTDLVARLLRGDRAAGAPAIASADVLAEFAGVYREARYATHVVDQRMRDQARAALGRLRAELVRPRRPAEVGEPA
ncbi:DUF4129 domain-containing protein [Plantactinospora siamensis]|uniref:DUF4129 domain-containing protein n=1 Tax=Plantactinospora siamensis TaxID=555372 RepID=A0ABV6NPE9_9ACTN